MNIQISDIVIRLENPVGNILLFTLLIVLTIIGYYYMVRLRERRATAFGNIRTIERVQGFRRYSPSNVVLIMKIILISLLFLAATQSIELRQKLPVTDTDYMLLIDSSGSMGQTDFSPNRLAAAKKLSQHWLDEVPNSTMIGIISFSDSVNEYVEPTLDKELLKIIVENINIDYSHAGTSSDYALNFAIDAFNDTIRNKSILLFTDGTQNVDPLVIARANQFNTPVTVFGIGTKNSSSNRTIPEEYKEFYSEMDMNFTLLEELANMTGGTAYYVSSEDELQASFSDATLRETQTRLNTNYYILILIAVLSIAELLIYSKEGAL